MQLANLIELYRSLEDDKDAYKYTLQAVEKLIWTEYLKIT